MTTNETATEPVDDTEITTMNRHTPIAPVDVLPTDPDGLSDPADAEEPAGTPVKPTTKPQQNRHTPAEPAD